MRGFVKSIILIIIFFALIFLSFIWFNRDKKSIENVPYVEEFFEKVDALSAFMDSISIKFFPLIDKKNREDK
jgi:hypothetical protein